jgi:hypothetical protein
MIAFIVTLSITSLVIGAILSAGANQRRIERLHLEWTKHVIRTGEGKND